MIELYRNPKVSVPDYRSMDPLLVHVAFVSENLPADRDRLVAAGATVVDDVVKTPAGDELMMLRDPWGLALQLASEPARCSCARGLDRHLSISQVFGQASPPQRGVVKECNLARRSPRGSRRSLARGAVDPSTLEHAIVGIAACHPS